MADIYINEVIDLKKIRDVIFTILIILTMAGLIVYSDKAAEAAVSSVKRCITVIVPSLFAFMALSGFMIRSGTAGFISKPFDLTIGRLLRMPKGTSAIFIISNIAGYPVGASMLSEAVRAGRTDRRSAEAMAVYCYAGGPAYLINAVGLGIFSSKGAGLSVFLSVLTANVILAAIVNRLYKPRMAEQISGIKISADDLVSSVTDAGEKIFDMCFMIVWFSVMLAVAEGTGIPRQISNALGLSKSEGILVRSLVEITSSSSLNRNAIGYLPVLAALCSFGGLCVIMQVYTVIKNSLSLKLFLKWMPLRTVLVFTLSRLYNWLFLDNNIPAFSGNDELIVELDNLLPSLCLIMMIFILVLQKRLDFLRRV